MAAGRQGFRNFLFINDLVDVFFFLFLTRKDGCDVNTMIIIIGTLMQFISFSGYMYISLSTYTDSVHPCEKLTLFPLYNSGIKAFTASVAH